MTGLDEAFINPGAIVEHEGEFHMFANLFTGFPGISQIPHLTSADGLTWTLAEPDPVLTTQGIDFAPTGAHVSTGFVTGTAALLLGMNPALSADELEDILERTGVPVVISSRYGAGSVQERYGYLPAPALRQVRSAMTIHWAQVLGAAGVGGFPHPPAGGARGRGRGGIATCTVEAGKFTSCGESPKSGRYRTGIGTRLACMSPGRLA